MNQEILDWWCSLDDRARFYVIWKEYKRGRKMNEQLEEYFENIAIRLLKEKATKNKLIKIIREIDTRMVK